MTQPTPDYSIHFRLAPNGKVETWTTPDIKNTLAATHMAAIKQGKPGLGAAFDYLVACIGTIQRLSKGVKSSLLWTPNDYRD